MTTPKPLDPTIPSSRQICIKEAKDYWVTAAEWNGLWGPSYEIGIRQKTNREAFTLLQSGWNEATVVCAAEGVRIMLDGGLTPTEIQRGLLYMALRK